MTLRIAFLGNHAWSVPSLTAIAAEPDLDIVLAATNPPRPAGRGDRLRPTPVAEAARTLGVPVVTPEGVAPAGPGALAIADAEPDVVVVVAYGSLLPAEVLRVGRFGAVNLHFSLLPRWRGAAPVQHALLAGDAVTGVTVMQLDEGLDTGPVLAQLQEPIRPEDDAGSLGERLATVGATLLTGVLRRLGDPSMPARPQEDGVATWAPALGPDDRVLRWENPADELARRVRALAPSPGATATWRGTRVKVLEAIATREAVTGAPGTLVTADDRGVLVTTGDGALRLLRVAPAGKRAMSAADWARGARLVPGDPMG
jgi:methionyl-tRNA formyltransferase